MKYATPILEFDISNAQVSQYYARQVIFQKRNTDYQVITWKTRAFNELKDKANISAMRKHIRCVRCVNKSPTIL